MFGVQARDNRTMLNSSSSPIEGIHDATRRTSIEALYYGTKLTKRFKFISSKLKMLSLTSWVL